MSLVAAIAAIWLGGLSVMVALARAAAVGDVALRRASPEGDGARGTDRS